MRLYTQLHEVNHTRGNTPSPNTVDPPTVRPAAYSAYGLAPLPPKIPNTMAEPDSRGTTPPPSTVYVRSTDPPSVAAYGLPVQLEVKIPNTMPEPDFRGDTPTPNTAVCLLNRPSNRPTGGLLGLWSTPPPPPPPFQCNTTALDVKIPTHET